MIQPYRRIMRFFDLLSGITMLIIDFPCADPFLNAFLQEKPDKFIIQDLAISELKLV
jgi:hypothetical protein